MTATQDTEMPGPEESVGARKIRVLVDAGNCKPTQGGIRTYTVSLARSLARHPALFVSIASSMPDAFDRGAVRVLPRYTRNFILRAAWREANLKRIAADSDFDVVLATAPEAPVRSVGRPFVMVVHDVGPLVSPGDYGRLRRARFRLDFPRAVRCADVVVCVSETTRDALVECCGIRSGKCVVIGEATERLGYPALGDSRDGDYVLYVGSLMSHKNIDALIGAWAMNGATRDLELRLVGPASGEELRGLRRSAAQVGAADRICHLGFVSEERLAQLYGSARMVALPSSHEGYGLTVLEAMASGTPVVGSAIAAIREVGGDAVFLVDDYRNPRAWNEAITRLATDDQLSATLSRRGLERVRASSWESVADRFAELFTEITPVK